MKRQKYIKESTLSLKTGERGRLLLRKGAERSGETKDTEKDITSNEGESEELRRKRRMGI